ncbi:MAG TPA: XRE family transcriptional regulator [Candidatus Limnocylindrales bacterium]|nr:XRE family transcriptional regulator [Candidatus Limnocylindrales bacterium]
MSIDGGQGTATDRRPPPVGAQVRRWRTERGLTLAGVADRTGLNIGYLSQIENGKAVPSIGCLTTLSGALDVPIAWFFVDETPAPVVVRRSERAVTEPEGMRVERVDAGSARDISIVEVVIPPGGHPGQHAHAGDEHHVVLSGRFRMTQGDHVVEAGPGDYVRWDGTIPHDAEVISEEEGRLLIVSLRRER